MPRYISENEIYALFNLCGQASLHVGDIDVLPRADVVEASRLGKLGRLMTPYKGCPRGRMGTRGVIQTEFEVMALDAIEDIEGDRWVPVLAEDLNNLKARLNNTVEVVHGRWIEPYRQWVECSNCGKGYVKYEYIARANYCPNCGAKMDLKEDK